MGSCFLLEPSFIISSKHSIALPSIAFTVTSYIFCRSTSYQYIKKGKCIRKEKEEKNDMKERNDEMNRDNPLLRIVNVMYECGCFRFVIRFPISNPLLALCTSKSGMFVKKIIYFRYYSPAFTVICSLHFFSILFFLLYYSFLCFARQFPLKALTRKSVRI